MSVSYVGPDGAELWIAAHGASGVFEVVTTALAQHFDVPVGMTWDESDECHVDPRELGDLALILAAQWERTRNPIVRGTMEAVLPTILALCDLAGRPLAPPAELAEKTRLARRDMPT